MVKKDVKMDGLGSIIAKSYSDSEKGINPKNKNKQDKIYDLFDDKLEIVDSKNKEVNPNCINREIEWNDIKNVSKNGYFTTKPVSLWTNTDLFRYLKRLYESKYQNGGDIDMGRAGNPGFIKKLNEIFKEFIGEYAPNILIKEYIEWFVVNELDLLMSKKGVFNPHAMRNKLWIKRFLRDNEKNSNHESLPEVFKNREDIIEKVERSFDDLDDLFRLNKVNFIMKYGIVMAFNWLIIKKNCSAEKSKNIIMNVLNDVLKDSMQSISMVTEATRAFSPYPKSYESSELREILAFINENNVKFSEKAKSYIGRDCG